MNATRNMPPRDAKGRFIKVARQPVLAPLKTKAELPHYTAENIERLIAAAIDQDRAKLSQRQTNLVFTLIWIVAPFALLAKLTGLV